ncbi:Secreted protein OS=Streptomyces fumanus OX=67302 GN=GCM10018772_05770 PE=4 SV=1 [Streptomyces fumanus]
MDMKRIVAGSTLTLTVTGLAATPAMADEEVHGNFSQNIEIIRDMSPDHSRTSTS